MILWYNILASSILPFGALTVQPLSSQNAIYPANIWNEVTWPVIHAWFLSAGIPCTITGALKLPLL